MKEFTLVYQGGHHNVYCNTVEHIKTTGGYCWPEVNKDKAIAVAEGIAKSKGIPGYSGYFKCDCEDYITV